MLTYTLHVYICADTPIHTNSQTSTNVYMCTNTYPSLKLGIWHSEASAVLNSVSPQTINSSNKTPGKHGHPQSQGLGHISTWDKIVKTNKSIQDIVFLLLPCPCKNKHGGSISCLCSYLKPYFRVYHGKPQQLKPLISLQLSFLVDFLFFYTIYLFEYLFGGICHGAVWGQKTIYRSWFLLSFFSLSMFIENELRSSSMAASTSLAPQFYS